MRFLLLAIFSSAVVAAGVVPLLDCSTVAQAQQDQITAERLFASLKGCIARYFQCNVALPASDVSSMDMKSGLRELTALSLLSALCLGLAWAHDDMFFAAIFGGASAITIIEAVRGLR